VGVLAIVAAVLVIVLLELRGTQKALADPSQAAAAAEHARTFAFTSRSELRTASHPSVVSTTSGEVDLAGSGAFKVQVTTGRGVGFERIVFPKAVYARVVGARGARSWIGAHLSPPATITAYAGSAGGLGDPLKLMAALRRSGHTRSWDSEVVDHQHTRHYTLTLALGALLPSQAGVSAAVRAIPVKIGIWQAHDQRLVRAVRAFEIGGPRHQQLTIQTDFVNYGKPTAIHAPPGVPLTGSQALNPTADDPLGASLLGALAAGTGRSATPTDGVSRRSRPPRHGVARPRRSSGG
jgi:hypothetical protein